MSRIYISKAVALVNALAVPGEYAIREQDAYKRAMSDASALLRQSVPDEKTAPVSHPKSDQELEDEAKFDRVITAFEDIAKSLGQLANSARFLETKP